MGRAIAALLPQLYTALLAGYFFEPEFKGKKSSTSGSSLALTREIIHRFPFSLLPRGEDAMGMVLQEGFRIHQTSLMNVHLPDISYRPGGLADKITMEAFAFLSLYRLGWTSEQGYEKRMRARLLENMEWTALLTGRIMEQLEKQTWMDPRVVQKLRKISHRLKTEIETARQRILDERIEDNIPCIRYADVQSLWQRMMEDAAAKARTEAA